MNKSLGLWLVLVLTLGLFVTSCEKEITVDLPTVESKVVVQGSIEQGQPPFVLLSESQGYFEPTDISSLESYFLRDAAVTVSYNSNEIMLDEICSSDIPEELLPAVTEITGFSAELLAAVDICAYTVIDGSLLGETNTIYDLEVQHNGRIATSRTKINELVTLDSAYFQLTGTSDSLGFAYAQLTDPDTIGNAYRWFAQRINRYPEWSENAGEQKDATYIAPLGSSYDDEFFNGLSFEFAYYRGLLLNSDKEDDLNEERGFFKVGDTIAVRGCHIDRAVYEFITSFENQVGNQGSPFAVPTNVETNVEGGLGAWIGYAASYDTIICVP